MTVAFPRVPGPYAYSGAWGERLRLADNPDELMEVVQSFLAACEVSDSDLLSNAADLRRCCSITDLKEMVIGLGVARAGLVADGAEVPRDFQRLFQFFTDAATRLGNLELEQLLPTDPS